MTSSPISDINPILTAASAMLKFQKINKDDKITSRKVIMNDDFFTGYRKTLAAPEEVLTHIFIPFNKKVRISK